MKYKIAIVTPWFGKDLKGGAEQLSWQLSERLSNHDNIQLEVITTCSKSFLEDWFYNFYKEGISSENNIKINTIIAFFIPLNK